jgi:hypothetical protein
LEEYLGGYSWVNLHAAGVVGGTLVVVVEVPARASGAPPSAAAVNLSGPATGIVPEVLGGGPA